MAEVAPVYHDDNYDDAIPAGIYSDGSFGVPGHEEEAFASDLKESQATFAVSTNGEVTSTATPAAESEPATESTTAESSEPMQENRRRDVLARVGGLFSKVGSIGAKLSKAGENLANGPTLAERATAAFDSTEARLRTGAQIAGAVGSIAMESARDSAKETWDKHQAKVKFAGMLALGMTFGAGYAARTSVEKVAKYGREQFDAKRAEYRDRASEAEFRKSKLKVIRTASTAEYAEQDAYARANKLEDRIDRRAAKFDAKLQTAAAKSYGSVPFYRNTERVLAKRQAKFDAIETKKNAKIGAMEEKLVPKINAHREVAEQQGKIANRYRRIQKMMDAE